MVKSHQNISRDGSDKILETLFDNFLSIELTLPVFLIS